MAPLALPSAASRTRWLAGILVAALVNGAWLLLFQWQRSSRPATALATVAELRLVPIAPAAPTRGAPSRAAGPVASARPTALAVVPAAVPAVPMAAEPVAPAAPVAVSAAPLRLSLPAERAASGPRPPSMLSQMLNDPRWAGPRRGVEYAVADAAGTLPVTVAISTDGRDSKLIRQGSKCTRVTEARIRTLHPMDEFTKEVLPVAGACY